MGAIQLSDFEYSIVCSSAVLLAICSFFVNSFFIYLFITNPEMRRPRRNFLSISIIVFDLLKTAGTTVQTIIGAGERSFCCTYRNCVFHGYFASCMRYLTWTTLAIMSGFRLMQMCKVYRPEKFNSGFIFSVEIMTFFGTSFLSSTGFSSYYFRPDKCVHSCLFTWFNPERDSGKLHVLISFYYTLGMLLIITICLFIIRSTEKMFPNDILKDDTQVNLFWLVTLYTIFNMPFMIWQFVYVYLIPDETLVPPMLVAVMFLLSQCCSAFNAFFLWINNEKFKIAFDRFLKKFGIEIVEDELQNNDQEIQPLVAPAIRDRAVASAATSPSTSTSSNPNLRMRVLTSRPPNLIVNFNATIVPPTITITPTPIPPVVVEQQPEEAQPQLREPERGCMRYVYRFFAIDVTPERVEEAGMAMGDIDPRQPDVEEAQQLEQVEHAEQAVQVEQAEQAEQVEQVEEVDSERTTSASNLPLDTPDCASPAKLSI